MMLSWFIPRGKYDIEVQGGLQTFVFYCRQLRSLKCKLWVGITERKIERKRCKSLSSARLLICTHGFKQRNVNYYFGTYLMPLVFLAYWKLENQRWYGLLTKRIIWSMCLIVVSHDDSVVNSFNTLKNATKYWDRDGWNLRRSSEI